MAEGTSEDHHGPFQRVEEEEVASELRPLLRRASVRSFSDREIRDEELNVLLEASCRAPTGGNLQPYSILVVRNAEMRSRLATACHQRFMADAPVHLIHCLDLHRLRRWAELSDAPFAAHESTRVVMIAAEDTLIAAHAAVVAGEALGMGSVYIGTILEFLEEMRQWFDLPPLVLPLILTCYGWPRGEIKPRARLPLELVCHSDRYQELSDEELREGFARKYQGAALKPDAKRRETLLRAAQDVGGAELESRVRARVEADGVINRAQHYFGLHYIAPLMRLDNTRFRRQVEAMGFDFFRDFGDSSQEWEDRYGPW